MPVTSKDAGYNALIKRAMGGKRAEITVGIPAKAGGEQHEGGKGVTILDVAQWLEFGTDVRPPLAFVRGWFDDNKGRCNEMIAAMMKSVLAGKRTREQALQLLGAKFAAEMQARMAAGIHVPDWHEVPGHTPGIDTGQTRSAITFEVKDK